MTLHLGDCREVLKTLPDGSVHAVVTDPPYGLAFMGKRWDYDVPSVEIWAECLRVLKPGGHLLAFAGTRTQHRMAVRIEDAGFEIRDLIAWVYGSGFPKSLDVSKAIDAAAGAEREVVGSRRLTGTARIKGQAAFGATSGRSDEAYQDGSEINDTLLLTAPATEAARQWSGWGTALKPSLETVTWATKPIPSKGEPAEILANLWKLEARLWLLSSASVAAQSSTSSPSEFDEACATAQWTADDATSTRAALRGLMDTWQYEMATHTSLNIVSSWRRTLAASSSGGNMFTTAMESKTITDWETLNCCLLQITPESIVKACSQIGGFDANASTAARIFNASLALLQSTLTLSAIEPATWQELDQRRGAGASPSVDPCIMARKPLAGTVAANVLEHGTGGLNIDGCRVEALDGYIDNAVTQGINTARTSYVPAAGRRTFEPSTVGRWPANLIHDGSDEVVALFPQNASPQPRKTKRSPDSGTRNGYGVFHGQAEVVIGYGDTGSAARFFYTAKASRDDRDDGNNHPTVKPTDLMRYLCRLVTPPGGIILDPFMGSGSTGKAAMLEGFEFIGIERNPDYFAIAERRIARAAAAGYQPSFLEATA